MEQEHLRFFNLATGASTPILRDIDVVTGATPHTYASDILRVSADATWLGLLEGGRITVRKLKR
jgi:hypothetical protein